MIDIRLGDCVTGMDALPVNAAHACVTDPPYGYAFMGATWDRESPGVDWAKALDRVLAPGGHVLAFASTRTDHRLKAALELGGFELRDTLGWVQWQGMPKSMNVASAIDKRRPDRDQVYRVTAWVREARDAAGINNKEIDDAFGFHGMAGHWTSKTSQPAVPTLEQVPTLLAVLGDPDVPQGIAELLITLNGSKGEPGEAWFRREVIGTRQTGRGTGKGATRIMGDGSTDITAPATEESAAWDGWGTALAPCHEPIVMARARMPGTVADNVLRYGTGAINVDACRLAEGDPAWLGPDGPVDDVLGGFGARNVYSGHRSVKSVGHPLGRWPGNLYYHPKVNTTEREFGLEHLPSHSAGDLTKRAEGTPGIASGRAGAGRASSGRHNNHPTVKPIELMRWLVRLVARKGQTVIDPYLGSGTTAIACLFEGVDFIGFEQDPDFHQLATERVNAWDHAIRGWKILHGRPATVADICGMSRGDDDAARLLTREHNRESGLHRRAVSGRQRVGSGTEHPPSRVCRLAGGKAGHGPVVSAQHVSVFRRDA